MGIRRNRTPGRPETPSPEQELSEAQVETPNQGDATLICTNVENQESLDENNLTFQLTEVKLVTKCKYGPKLANKKNNDRIVKMIEHLEKKLEAFGKET